MSLKLTFLSFLFSVFYLNLNAQEVHFVEIGINGLHCSACTFSVEKSLKKLDFVTVVQMDLNDRSGKAYFKEDSKVDYKQLAKAVSAAGFSVRSFDIVFREKLEEALTCVGSDFCIVGKEIDQGDRLRIIGKGFQEKKAFRNSAHYLKESCEQCTESSQRFKVILL